MAYTEHISIKYYRNPRPFETKTGHCAYYLRTRSGLHPRYLRCYLDATFVRPQNPGQAIVDVRRVKLTDSAEARPATPRLSNCAAGSHTRPLAHRHATSRVGVSCNMFCTRSRPNWQWKALICWQCVCRGFTPVFRGAPKQVVDFLSHLNIWLGASVIGLDSHKLGSEIY